MNCPKCNGSMSEGFIVDQGYGEVAVSKWQDGPPRKSFWTMIKASKEDQHPIVSFRCDRCGYLENYAK